MNTGMKLTAALPGDKKLNEFFVSPAWWRLKRCVDLPYIIFFVAALSLANPALAVDKNTSMPGYSFQVSVREFTAAELASFQLQLKQPYALDARRVSLALSRLAYQQKKILWSDNKRAFSSLSGKVTDA